MNNLISWGKRGGPIRVLMDVDGSTSFITSFIAVFWDSEIIRDNQSVTRPTTVLTRKHKNVKTNQ